MSMVKAAIKDMVKHPNLKKEACCHYAYKAPKDVEIYKGMNAPCFYSLRARENGIEELRIALPLLPDFTDLQKEYFDWVLRESYWSPAFLEIDDNLYENGLLMNSEKDFSFVIAAAIAVRFTWEFTKLLPYWKKLIENGVDKATAHHVASTTYLGRDEVVQLFSSTGSHGNFQNLDKAAIKQYKGQHPDKDKFPMSKMASAYYIFDIFQGQKIMSRDVIAQEWGFNMNKTSYQYEMKFDDFVKELLK